MKTAVHDQEFYTILFTRQVFTNCFLLDRDSNLHRLQFEIAAPIQ